MLSVSGGGIDIPALGFGTWQLAPNDARRMVAAALDMGYRHIDTAFIYENEAAVGQGIRDSGVPRDQIFLTTKIWTSFFRDGDLQRAAEGSAERLGGPVDLLLLHWPQPQPPLAETIKALNEARAAGLTRAIGLSNFPSAMMEEAARLSEAPIATNQVEYHPYLRQQTLMETARRLGSSITAWSPLARGKIADDPLLAEIAGRHGKTPGQVTLRWLVQQGVVAIPKTNREARARENLDIFDFELTNDEMRRISALGSPEGRLGNWLDSAFQWDAA